MKILYTSAEVRNEIVRLFRESKGRRVAVAAYVGKGAESYLPKPGGLELYCCPQAGGTNAEVVRRLIGRGAKVWFVESLHMKVYWTDGGAIITSANLSTNALGSGNLKELGILVPASYLDIDRVIASLNCKPVTDGRLAELDKATQAFNTGAARPITHTRVSSYKEWYESSYRRKWKLGWWDAVGGMSANAKTKSQEEYGVPTPHNFVSCSQSDYEFGDCVLTFDISGKSPKTIRWLFIDFVVRVAKTDKKAYYKDWPYQAVQVWPAARYQPPFMLDRAFQAAFKRAVKEYGADELKGSSTTTPPKLLKLIYG